MYGCNDGSSSTCPCGEDSLYTRHFGYTVYPQWSRYSEQSPSLLHTSPSSGPPEQNLVLWRSGKHQGSCEGGSKVGSGQQQTKHFSTSDTFLDRNRTSVRLVLAFSVCHCGVVNQRYGQYLSSPYNNSKVISACKLAMTNLALIGSSSMPPVLPCSKPNIFQRRARRTFSQHRREGRAHHLIRDIVQVGPEFARLVPSNALVACDIDGVISINLAQVLIPWIHLVISIQTGV